MDANELWERAGLVLKEKIPQLTYEYLIKDNLYPETLENGTLVLRIAMDALKTALNPYAGDIADAVQKVSGRPVRVEILTRAELQQKQTEAKEGRRGISLIDRYTFDTFVVGASNRFAHAAAIAVAEAPGQVYNPLFIYGGSGLGKTHLMHAIGHYIQKRFPEKRMLYITSEAFTNELISAIQQGRNPEFRAKMRNVDILMVDDIQSIAGRDSTQMEFFNTFNDLYGEKKQIILTSDRPPKEISPLEERLRSRFDWGLTCDIQRPDLETRIAILRAFAHREYMNVPDDVLESIAVAVDSNIRELEEKMNRLKAYATMMNRPYSAELCREALREVFEQKHQRAITADLILRTVCNFFTLRQEDLTGPSRRREVVVPRQIAMYLTRDMTNMSLPQIGAFYGNRDHTTVLHACAAVSKEILENEAFASQTDDIRKLVLEN